MAWSLDAWQTTQNVVCYDISNANDGYMQIIESRSDFDTFLKRFKGQSSILVPIAVDSRQHVATNRLCLMGVCEMYSGEVTILPFDHPEVTNLPIELVDKFAQGLELWTPDRKELS